MEILSNEPPSDVRYNALRQLSSIHYFPQLSSGRFGPLGYSGVIGPLTPDVIVQHRIDSTAGANPEPNPSIEFQLLRAATTTAAQGGSVLKSHYANIVASSSFIHMHHIGTQPRQAGGNTPGRDGVAFQTRGSKGNVGSGVFFPPRCSLPECDLGWVGGCVGGGEKNVKHSSQTPFLFRVLILPYN